jgi:tRNA nucleotidyltransferase/poly(A) polymerase
MKIKSFYEFVNESYKSSGENLSDSKDFQKTLPKEIKDLANLFEKHGHELMVVGGAVRDFLMGKEPKDYDLATDAKPDEIENILSKHYKTLDVGKQFGVIVAVIPNFPEGVEIATYREDVYSDNDKDSRNPSSIKYSTIEKDVRRRDLTLNALFYDVGKNQFVDLVGGKEDIANKVVDTVGKAEERFEEDPLRKLRAIRFTAIMKGDLKDHVSRAIKKNNLLTDVSRERIIEEFRKGIEKSKSTEYYLELLDEHGFLSQIFVGYETNKNFIESNKWRIVMAALLTDIDSEQRLNILKKMKLSKQDFKSIDLLASLKHFDPKEIYSFKRALDKVNVSKSEVNEFVKKVGGNKNMIIKAFEYELSIEPEKLIQKGYEKQEIGKKLKELEYQNFLKYLKNK